MTTSVLLDSCVALEGLLREFEHSMAAQGLAALIERLREPRSFVAVIGETSTGKSALVNAMFGVPLLPSLATPTTATVIRVSCRDIDTPRFRAIPKEGEPHKLSPAQFTEAALHPPSGLLRLELDARPNDSRCLHFDVLDTPGYNSLLREHEEVLHTAIPSSDALLFVVGFRTGFGQVDQDLFEATRTSVREGIPVVLAINRVPTEVGTSHRRVAEILRHAADSLGVEPRLVLVGSVEGSSPSARIPDGRELWSKVAECTDTPAQRRSVDSALRGALQRLVSQLDLQLAREVASLETSADERAETRRHLDAALKQSQERVGETMGRLLTLLPAMVRRSGESIRLRLREEIDSADAWTGKEATVAYVQDHVLPTEARQLTKALEQAIEVELDDLDRALDEIGNTAVQRIERSVRLRGDAAGKFAISVARTLAERIGGTLTTSALSGFGGVGGAAAGAGNLVKTVLRRAGELVGKRFSREVYRTIGRVFTKRVVQALGVGLSVAIEAAVFLWDVGTWRNKLFETASDAIRGWESNLTTELVREHIPAIATANEKSVAAMYEDLIQEAVAESASDGQRRRVERASQLASVLDSVRKALAREADL